MNLGIVIAVSNYGSPSNNLPGCDADGSAIAKILKTDNKFDHVLYLSEKTNSSDVKSDLIRFISQHKENEIEDVVFYFTGHGDFTGDEFYYLLSDYDRKRKKQTCLENTELDNLIKTLNPRNAIKIVDACHSGTPYIKDEDSFDSYLKGTKGEYEKCYFMFSSQTDQYSYQDNRLSFFTKSIIEAVQQHSSEEIRYKDIIDYVADSFIDNQNQTPFFIVQADFTESFCSVSDALRHSLKEILIEEKGGKELNENESEIEQRSLIDLVKEDADRFCTEEEALSCISDFFYIFKASSLEYDIKDLYEISAEEVFDYSEIPSSSSIGKWLDSNEHDFFAEPYKEMVSVRQRVHKDPIKTVLGLPSLGALGIEDEENYKYVIKQENRIKGFRATVDLPIKLLQLTAEAKFPNIDSASLFIVPVISKTQIRLFFSFNFYEQKGWDEREISGPVKWLTEEVGIKDTESHQKLCSKIIRDFSAFVYAPITEKFTRTDRGDAADSDKSEA